MLLLRSYKANVEDVAKHLNWPEAKVRAALNYLEAFSAEVNELIAENDSTDFDSLKRILPKAVDFAAKKDQAG
jgi:ABC-type transporter Mla subunit MlaD